MKIQTIDDSMLQVLTHAFERELLLQDVGYKDMELKVNRNNELVFFVATEQGKSFLWRWHKKLSMGKSVMEVVTDILSPALCFQLKGIKH